MISLYQKAAHFHEVNVGDMSIFFSYATPIGFTTRGGGLIVRENTWSITTGKHLNMLNSDKKARVESKEFEELLSQAVNKRGM